MKEKDFHVFSSLYIILFFNEFCQFSKNASRSEEFVLTGAIFENSRSIGVVNVH